jgi:hypothetical protein
VINPFHLGYIPWVVFLALFAMNLVFLCAPQKKKSKIWAEWVLQIIFSTNMLSRVKAMNKCPLDNCPRGARNNKGYSRALFSVWFVKTKVSQGKNIIK